jgi:surface polysaccharide O-acyltransferase-like enzyme
MRELPISRDETEKRLSIRSAHRPFDERIVVLRGIACILVVVVHVSALNFYPFSPSWTAVVAYDSLARPCIGLFLMISGVLLLPLKSSLGHFLRKRTLRIVPPLCFWTVIYALRLSGSADVNISARLMHVGSLLKQALTQPIVYHLWYLYALIGITAFIPIISSFYSGSDRWNKMYFMVLWVAICIKSIYPALYQANITPANVLRWYNLTYFSGLIGYVFAGAYLYEILQPIKDRRALWLFIYLVMSLLTALATVWYSTKVGKPDEFFLQYVSPFVVTASLALFALFLCDLSLPVGVKKPLILVSNLSLGIYCIHVLVLMEFRKLTFISNGLSTTPLLFIPVTTICVLIVSAAIIGLIRLVPVFRNVT